MEARCSYSPGSDGTDNQTVQRFKELLVDVYRVYKRDKVMPKEKRAYCNGYADALLTTQQISYAQLHKIIDEANMDVFGMTLKQRQYEFDVFNEPSLMDPNPNQPTSKVDSVT